MNIEPTYDIDAPVHHICDEKVRGIVIDWRYFRKLVTFGTGICGSLKMNLNLQKMSITNRIENIIIAVVAIVLTVIFLEIVRIQPLKKEMAIQKVDFDKRIDKQNAIIVDLAKIEKYKIENRFDKLKAKDGQIVLQLDNKLTALQLDSIKPPEVSAPEAKKNLLQKLKFW